jgi:hypothetical protein
VGDFFTSSRYLRCLEGDEGEGELKYIQNNWRTGFSNKCIIDITNNTI